jgi:hypothetical protein
MDYPSGGLDHSAVKSLYATNKSKSMTSLQRCKDVQYKDMQVDPRRKGDPSYKWHSHATTAFRNGITDDAGVNFVRCAATGTWFQDRPERRKDFHYTGSSLNMKFTEVANEKSSAAGGFRQTHSVFAAPVAGGFWVERKRDAPKSMIIVSTGDMSSSSVGNQAPLVKASSLPQLKKNVNSLRKSSQIDKVA